MMLTDFFETKYAPRRLRGKSQNSYRLYRLCIKRFGESIGRTPTIADLTNDNLLLHLSRRGNVSPATRNKELAELCAMWRLAVQLEMHSGWPDVLAEDEPRRAPRAWLPDEFSKLLAACNRSRGLIGRAPAKVFWSAIVNVALDTGERVGALLACQWSWIEGERLLIRAEARKGGKADKWFVLSEESRCLLGTLRGYSDDDTIFHWPYHRTYFWSKYRQIVASAGLPVGRDCGMHRIRKCCASVLHANGLDATQALGHSDTRTTQRYIDERFLAKTQTSEVLRKWLRG